MMNVVVSGNMQSGLGGEESRIKEEHQLAMHKSGCGFLRSCPALMRK